MKSKMLILLLLLQITLTGSLLAQSEDLSFLTVDRIFNSSDFRAERFGPARWLDDGKGYTTLEKSDSKMGGRDIVRYETRTGKREILVPARQLVPPGDSTALEISNYEWSPDKRYLLIFTNTRRVWRQNTRGDYWVVDLKTWGMRQLGGDAEASTLMFATFHRMQKK